MNAGELLDVGSEYSVIGLTAWAGLAITTNCSATSAAATDTTRRRICSLLRPEVSGSYKRSEADNVKVVSSGTTVVTKLRWAARFRDHELHD